MCHAIRPKTLTRIEYMKGGLLRWMIAGVCQSVTRLRCANMVERIAVLLGMETGVPIYPRIRCGLRQITFAVCCIYSCRASDRYFDVLTAAYILHPGSALAGSLGLSEAEPATDLEHTLVAVFADRRVPRRGSSPERLDPSDAALCIFSMAEIRREFTRTIQDCFRGNGTTGPDHYVQPKTCYKTVCRFHLLLERRRR